MFANKLPIQTAEIYACVFALDGARALTGAQGNPVRLWDVGTGQCVRVFDHPGPVWSLAWRLDQQSFLSVDGTLRLWDVEAGTCLRQYDGHSARCVAWSSDGRQALSASHASVRLTDLESGQCIRVMEGHTDGIYCVAFDAERRRALSGSRDTTVRV